MSTRYNQRNKRNTPQRKKNTPAKTHTKADVERGKLLLMRSLSAIWVVGALLFTAIFSANGFSELFFGGDTIAEVFGYFMAFGVFFFQLYFYQGYTENVTLLLLSIGAFVYSVWATWAGLMGEGNLALSYLIANKGMAIGKLFFALVIDLTAEPLLLYTIYGQEGLRHSDAIGRVLDWLIPGDQSSWWRKKSFSFGTKRSPRQSSGAQQSPNRPVQQRMYQAVSDVPVHSDNIQALQQELRNM